VDWKLAKQWGPWQARVATRLAPPRPPRATSSIRVRDSKGSWQGSRVTFGHRISDRMTSRAQEEPGLILAGQKCLLGIIIDSAKAAQMPCCRTTPTPYGDAHPAVAPGCILPTFEAPSASKTFMSSRIAANTMDKKSSNPLPVPPTEFNPPNNLLNHSPSSASSLSFAASNSLIICRSRSNIARLSAFDLSVSRTEPPRAPVNC